VVVDHRSSQVQTEALVEADAALGAVGLEALEVFGVGVGRGSDTGVQGDTVSSAYRSTMRSPASRTRSVAERSGGSDGSGLPHRRGVRFLGLAYPAAGLEKPGR